MRFAPLIMLIASTTVVSAQDKKPDVEAPFVSTPHAVVAAMLKLAAVKDTDVVLDLGCGDGRIAVAAVRDFKAKRGIGVDVNADRVRESQAAARKAGPAVEKKCAFRRGDVLTLTEADLGGIDVVTLYLLPELNARLAPVLRKGLKPGSRVVSHDFDMGDDWKPTKTVDVEVDGLPHTIHLWVVAADK